MNKYLKLVIAALLVALAVFLFTQREYGWGIVSLLLAAFPVLFYFRNENILLAFWFLRKEDMVKAGRWLDRVTNPTTQLIPKQMGYFHYMKGIVTAQDNNNLGQSEKYMKDALQYGLSFDHDRAMANLSLAGAAMAKGKKREAEVFIKEAKKNDVKGMFTDQIKMMNDQMKRFSVSTSQLQNPNMRHRGKKF